MLECYVAKKRYQLKYDKPLHIGGGGGGGQNARLESLFSAR